jgi:hypothetical protein
MHLRRTGQQSKSSISDKLTWFTAKILHRALGIASLGKEVLSSLNALYAEDETFPKAEELGIFAPKSDFDRIVTEGCLRDSGDSPSRPDVMHLNSYERSKAQLTLSSQVLICRAYDLQGLVNYQRSWWPSLIRDMKKQFQVQPLFFYGAILAVFFGVCTMIQTVTSVWSLVLTLRAAK